MRTDLKCPRCGYIGGVYIRARATVRVDSRDDCMSLETDEPVEWSEKSRCECGGCGYVGVVADFRQKEEPTDELDQD